MSSKKDWELLIAPLQTNYPQNFKSLKRSELVNCNTRLNSFLNCVYLFLAEYEQPKEETPWLFLAMATSILIFVCCFMFSCWYCVSHRKALKVNERRKKYYANIRKKEEEERERERQIIAAAAGDGSNSNNDSDDKRTPEEHFDIWESSDDSFSSDLHE